MRLAFEREELEVLKSSPELLMLTPQAARLAEASQSLKNARTVISLSPQDPPTAQSISACSKTCCKRRWKARKRPSQRRMTPAADFERASAGVAQRRPLNPMPGRLAFFRLKPIRAARVSEISETTAAAPVPDEERVNFHIGNPLQDARLSSAFLRIALGIDVHLEDLRDTRARGHPGLPGLESRPISPPGKARFPHPHHPKELPLHAARRLFPQKPHALVKAFCAWLERQQDPLHYDTGEQSGRREIILASGGIQEALRIMLFALSSYLEITPARILCYRCELPPAV